MSAEIDHGSWPIPPIFPFLQEHGKLKEEEMFNVFNMGIGFVLAVKEEDLTDVIDTLEAQGEKAYLIGRVKRAKAFLSAVRLFHEKVCGICFRKRIELRGHCQTHERREVGCGALASRDG